MDRDTRLGILASAILEGTPVDWGSAEATAEASDRPLLRQLHVVAEIAALHRRSGRVPATETPRDSAIVAPGPNTSWGDLRLIERIGRGTFGDVYRAWDPHLDRDVALKLLRAHPAAGDPSASLSDPARVVNEGRLLARVRHPNVITVYGAEPRDGAVGIWMEFIRGRTLHDMVEQQGPFGAREAAGIGADLCRALAAVHAAGLLHRDVTARNVMREDGGRLVLMDFGVGHELGEQAQSRGMDVTGTPLYMAPELFIGERADQRTDIYSLGVLLYFIVTGRFPVTGRTLAEIGEAHARGVRTQLRDSRPDLPPPLVRAIEAALTTNPAGRFQTAGEFDVALEAGIQVRRATHPRSTGWGWKLAVGTIGAAAVAGLAGVAVTSLQRGDNSSGAPPELASTSVTMRRLSSLPAVWGLSNPSDDGRFAAASTLESSDAAIVNLATGEFRALGIDRLDSSGEGGYASSTVLSPDGTTVAVNWWTEERGTLRIVRVDGSGLRTLVDSGRDAHPYQWSRDGSMIVTAIADGSGTYTIALVAAVDGAIRPLRRLAGWLNELPHQVSLSPDGRYVAYDYPEGESTTDRDIFILDTHTGDQWALDPSPGLDISPVWAPEGEELVFFSDRNRTLSVWAVALDNGRAREAPRLVKDDVGRVRVRGFTRSGSLHVDLTVGYPDVFISTLDGVPTSAQAISPRLSWGNFYPVWSPDGLALAYTSERRDNMPRELWVLDMSSGRESRVASREQLGRPIGWSPDGTRILASGENNQRLYVVNRATGDAEVVAGAGARARWLPEGLVFEGQQRVVLYDVTARRPLRTFDFRNSQVASFGLAHDGRSVLAVLKSGQHVLYDTRTGVSREWRDPGVKRTSFHAMAPHAAAVAYVANRKELASEAKTLMVWGGSGEPRELLRMRADDGVQLVGWTNDGLNVLLIRWSPPTPGAPAPVFRTLWSIPILSASPVATPLTMEGFRDVSLHPDGRRIAFNAGWKKYESWVMENLLPK